MISKIGGILFLEILIQRVTYPREVNFEHAVSDTRKRDNKQRDW